MSLLSLYSSIAWDYTKGMNEADAKELLTLVASLDSYMDGPDFIPKAVGYDALAVAKSNQDLFSLRLYSRLFPSGANVRDIKEAVKTAKLFPNEEMADLTVEQVETHAIVAKAIKGASGFEAMRIRKIALMYPGHGDFIVELIVDREIGDPTQIRAILAQSGAVTTPLHDGVL